MLENRIAPAAVFSLATLNGSNGFKVSGFADAQWEFFSFSGASVSTAGDVNGDGFDDVIIGGYRSNPNGSYSGASYVVFGKATGFAADLNLSTLDGSNGFKLSGVAAQDRSGFSVSAAGDINGDGFGDLIIGVPGADPNGSNSGASYVVFGRASGFAANVNLSMLDGSNGFTLSGAAAYDSAGDSVGGAGDVNGDGFDDLIIGAPGADPNGSNSGASYVVFGRATGFAANINLSTLDGTNGFKLSGVAAGDSSGRSVGGAGDVNGDGFGDLIIGAELARPSFDRFGTRHQGTSYVVFGKSSGFAANLNLSELDGSNGFELPGVFSDDRLGHSVSRAGDVNGDGFDDVIIGAPEAISNGVATGVSYVVFGFATPPLPAISISDVSLHEGNAGLTAASFTVTLSRPSPFSVSVQYSTADGSATAPSDYAAVPLTTLTFPSGVLTKTLTVSVNGDSVGELDETFFINLSNPTSATIGDAQGQGTIIDDDSVPPDAVFELSSLNGSNGFKINGLAAADAFGSAVSDAGDVNGDGLGDVIVSAPAVTSEYVGATYVVFGRASGFSADFNLATLDGTNGFKLSNIESFGLPQVPAGNYSISVSAAGDFNGDGFGDLIIGAPGADPNGTNSGASYVIFGKRSGFAANLDVLTLDGRDGFTLSGGAAGDQFGTSVSGAGDVNGDDFDDVIIGTPGAGQLAGASYVVFGKASGLPANLNVSALDGTNGFALLGRYGRSVFPNGMNFVPHLGDLSGRSVSGAGDVNGDGFDDVIIGAPNAYVRFDGVRSASYVVFGKPGGFAASLSVTALDGTNGFTLGWSGYSVSGAGDINGDGFDDLMLGAAVVFGKASGFPVDLHLSQLDGRNGFKLSGAPGESTGASVSAAGDVDGDGFDDLIIGAPGGTGALSGTSGASYLVFGKPNGFFANLNLSALAGNGWMLRGVAMNDSAGGSVSAAGDVDGDGLSDLIIGARDADPNGASSGASYVVFGKSFSNPALAISINDVSVAEGATGTAIASFTVSLSGMSARPVTVQYATANGTAAASDDYAPVSLTTLTFNPGEVSKTVTISINGDTVLEPHEIFFVNLSNPTNATIGDGQGQMTILDDDGAHPPPSISIDDTSITEGSGGSVLASFTISLSAASSQPVNVQYAATNGTAIAPGDYLWDYVSVALSTLTFNPGEVSKTLVVTVKGDTVVEPDETFFVNLSNPISATIADAQGQGTILNDDGLPSLSINDTSITESAFGIVTASFTVTLSEPISQTVKVRYATSDGTATAPGDYKAVGSTLLTFNPGEISKTVVVMVNGDVAFEPNETFFVNLSSPINAAIADGQGQGTILNDDATVSINDVSVVEGEAGDVVASFAVTLSAPSTETISVRYTTANGTATAPEDYTPVGSAVLTFNPGEISKTVSVTVKGDTVVEPDETFFVNLSNPINATIADAQGRGTILNDDPSGVPSLRINDVSVVEGQADSVFASFAVTLSAPSMQTVSVQYATTDGTATGPGEYGSIELSTLTFNPGEVSKTIAVAVLGDTSIEANETFSVVLSNAANAVIASGSGTATILNDDTALRVDDSSVLEGHGGERPMTFTISLAEPSVLPVSVSFMNVGGTATVGVDYALSSGTVTFAPGETRKLIPINIIGDTVAESTETLSLVLSDPINSTIEDDTGVMTILDDDVTLHGKRTAVFTDVDGDRVMIKVSKGALNVEDFAIVPAGAGAQLALVNFSGQPEFAGANLSITAKRVAGTIDGDGMVNVGHVDLAGIDFGNVVVNGDLGQIDAGNDLDPRPGLLSLSAHSLGHSGLGTQPPGGSMQSDIVGALKKFKIDEGMSDAALAVSGNIGTIVMKGSVLGSAIRSDGNIGVVRISGDLAAGATISALGHPLPESKANALAIKSLSIGGSADHAQILAGYDRTDAAINGDAGIGRVTFGGDWTASNLVAGVSRGTDGMFGTDDDLLIPGGNQIIARIASIVIRGATGTDGGTDHFGVVAEEIAAFKSSGTKLMLTPGPRNDLTGMPLGSGGDMTVREVG